MAQPHTAPRVAVVGIVISFILAVGVAGLRSFNADPVERVAEAAGTIAFATVFAAPALLALLGVRGRPSLLLAAGALDMVLAFLALFSFIGLVFVIPAVLFFLAAGRTRSDATSPIRSAAAVAVAVVLGTAGFFALFAHENPICWARNPATGQSYRLDADRFVHGSTMSMDSRDLPAVATESGCSSDSILISEAIAVIVVVASMLGATWLVSKPPRMEPVLIAG